MAWNQINTAYPQILRGILQQTSEGLLYEAPTFNAGGVSTRMTGLTLRRFELNNRAAANNIGIGFRWANQYWGAGQWDDSEAVAYIDDTTDAQDDPTDSTGDFALMTTTASDGWVVHSDRPFSWVSVRVETADIGASADVTARYTNFAGTGWTAITAGAQNFEVSTSSLIKVAGVNYTDATEYMFVWAPPNNWGRTPAAGLTGIPGGRYALNFRCDVATTAGVASAIEVGSLIGVEEVATLGVYSDENSTFSDPYADAVIAFFEIANEGNRVRAEVTTG